MHLYTGHSWLRSRYWPCLCIAVAKSPGVLLYFLRQSDYCKDILHDRPKIVPWVRYEILHIPNKTKLYRLFWSRSGIRSLSLSIWIYYSILRSSREIPSRNSDRPLEHNGLLHLQGTGLAHFLPDRYHTFVRKVYRLRHILVRRSVRSMRSTYNGLLRRWAIRLPNYFSTS